MEYPYNYFEQKVINFLEEFDKRLENLEKDSKHLKNFIENNKTLTNQTNTFDLVSKKNAFKYLLCTKEKLNKAIQEGVLVEKIHYISNGKRKWRFSKIALEPLRGKL